MRSHPLLLVLPFFTLGCPEPPRKADPIENRPIQLSSALTAANQNFRTSFVGAARAGEFSAEHELLKGIVGGATTCQAGQTCEPDPEALEKSADELASEVATKILHVANVKSEEATRIVLQLDPEQACDEIRTVDDQGAPVTQLDQSCVDALTQVPVQFTLTSPSDGDIDVAIRVGSHHVGSIELHSEHIAATLDFGAGLDALQALAEASGDPMEELAGTIKGQVRAELRRNAANDFTASLSVLSPIRVDATVEGEALSLDIGTSSPLWSLRFDGNTPQIVSEANLGGATATIPYAIFPIDQAGACETEPCDAPERPSGILEVNIPKISSKVTLDTTDTVKTELSVGGPYTLRYNGLLVASVDLNPNNGRSVAAKLTAEQNDNFLFAFSPLLETQTVLKFSNLPNFDAPSILSNDTLRLLLDGDSEPTLRYRAQSEQVEVVSGRLTLSSQAAGRSVIINTGMCIDPGQEVPEGSHPFDTLAEAVCE